MATIIDVANRAGVSIKTVSRVMNNAKNVRAGTAEKVREAIAELNYQPSTAARELRSGRSRFIGMLFSDPSSGFQARLHHAALEACSDAGYFLAASLFDEGAPDWRQQFADFRRRSRADNVVLVPPLCDSPELQKELAGHDMAAVAIAPGEPFADAHAVRMDDYGAAREITQHLFDLGHTKLGHLTGPVGHIASVQRRAGFEDAIREHPVAILRDEWVLPGQFRFQVAAASAEAMLSGADRPTAIFASNDDTAAAVCFTAARLGLRVPDDLSVVGFDDVPIATTIWPPLTTIAQPFDAMARAVVELISETPTGPGQAWEPQIRTLGHELKVRASTAPPPAR